MAVCTDFDAEKKPAVDRKCFAFDLYDHRKRDSDSFDRRRESDFDHRSRVAPVDWGTDKRRRLPV